MFVNFSLFFFLISTSVNTAIRIPEGKLATNDQFIVKPVDSVSTQTSPWLDHIRDFLNLIDGEAILGTVVRFIDDPEVMRFIGFLLSPKFKDIIWEIEVMEEFNEAYIFLKVKGYDMQSVIDAVNSALKLPPFTPQPSLRYDKGVSGFIAAVIGTLPIEDIRELFKNKLENSPEFAGLCEVINSEEFLEIIKRMLSNPKFAEFKTIFENYGVDFKFIYEIIREVLGLYYSTVLCQNERIIIKMINIM